MSITQKLAEFVATTPYEQVPPSVLGRMKVHILDALASGFVGAKQEWAQMAEGMVLEQGGIEECSVFSKAGRVTASQAAFLNGINISGFEADHSGHHAHAGATVTPAALATGEKASVSGRELLLAMTLATEIGCRIGDAQNRAVEDVRGFHNPGVNGPYAAAAATGRLLGLDAGMQASAFGIAGSHSGGLIEYAWDGSMTKRLHLGRASQMGLESAFLAARGVTGPHTIIEGRYGLFNAFSPSPKPELALEGLGDEWRLSTTLIKPYPVHGSCQSTVAAVVELKTRHEVDPRSVTSIHVRSSDRRVLLERFLDPSPDTILGAQCSLPFTTAIAMLRDLDNPLELDESVLADEEIRRIAGVATFEMLEAAKPESPVEGSGWELELEIEADGAIFQVGTGPHKGSIANPASFDDIADKFHRFTAHALSDEARSSVIGMVENLEEIEDCSQVANAIRG